jgi:hypothetical protein
MHRKQDILHDILRLIDRLASAGQTPACSGSQNRCDGLEQTMIRRAIA